MSALQQVSAESVVPASGGSSVAQPSDASAGPLERQPPAAAALTDRRPYRPFLSGAVAPSPSPYPLCSFDLLHSQGVSLGMQQSHPIIFSSREVLQGVNKQCEGLSHLGVARAAASVKPGEVGRRS